MATGALPAALASLTLLIETAARRRDLTVYVCTQAVRIVLAKLHAQGTLPTLPHANLVALSTALGLLHQQRAHGTSRGLTHSLLAVLNPEPGQEWWQRVPRLSHAIQQVRPALLRYLLRPLHVRPALEQQLAHVLETSAMGALTGVALKLGLKLVQHLHQSSPRAGQAAGRSLPLIRVLALYPALFKATELLLGHFRGHHSDASSRAALAGGVATLALHKTVSPALSAYFLGKALDGRFDCARTDTGQDVALFASAAAVIVHFAIFEPQRLPASYNMFLNKVTGAHTPHAPQTHTQAPSPHRHTHIRRQREDAIKSVGAKKRKARKPRLALQQRTPAAEAQLLSERFLSFVDHGSYNAIAVSSAAADGHSLDSNAGTPTTTVFLRIRPKVRQAAVQDTGEDDPDIIQAVENTVIFDDVKCPDKEERFKPYTFDRVFQPGLAQADVFDQALQPYLRHFVAGFNVCLFCYGQTGSGKTHT
ncbi:uncharacterized protein MONBRDRAFT_27878, partial [Monosiga brevicollis MX1]